MNLRGDCKVCILNWIHENHSELDALYQMIYVNGDRSYWAELDEEIRIFTKREGLLYVRDDDSIQRPLDEPPIVVNCFFHDEIIPSSNKRKG